MLECTVITVLIVSSVRLILHNKTYLPLFIFIELNHFEHHQGSNLLFKTGVISLHVNIYRRFFVCFTYHMPFDVRTVQIVFYCVGTLSEIRIIVVDAFRWRVIFTPLPLLFFSFHFYPQSSGPWTC